MRVLLVGVGTLLILVLGMSVGDLQREAASQPRAPAAPGGGEKKLAAEEVKVSMCRVYHTMTLGSGVCCWYLLPKGCSGSPAGEMNLCDSPFGSCGCSTNCLHCTESFVLKEKHAITSSAPQASATSAAGAAAKSVGDHGAPRHVGRVKPSHGPETRLQPGKAEVVISFSHGGRTVIAHLFPMRSRPYKDDVGGRHDKLDYFVGRQVVQPSEEEPGEPIVIDDPDISPTITELDEKLLEVLYNGDPYVVVLESDSP